VEVSAEKKNPADFALWKKAEANHIMQWPSPWGQGFPGWHLECSVMSTKYLGQPFDIHGGGLENQFPHHECEIAQAEAATGKQFVNYWLHNNMVTVDGQKMGKSLGNFITLKQVFADWPDTKHERLSRKYDSLAVRQFILTSHYRSTLDFSDEALHAAQSGYEKITDAVKAVRKKIKNLCNGMSDINKSDNQNISRQILSDNINSSPIYHNIENCLEITKEKFEKAMNDDLNTSVALSTIFDLVNYSNDILKTNESKIPSGDSFGRLLDYTLDTTKTATYIILKKIDDLFKKLGGEILGIVKDKYEEGGESNEIVLDKVVNILIEQRKSAKQNKDFATADALRKKIEEIGIVLEDKPGGVTGWRMK
jgi:cysteinyl-tRNA synthetase